MKPVALVTASSQGMGEAIARELHARGYALALMARSDRIMTLADELGGVAVQGSVTDPADLERFVTMATERYGRIDAVVNHTGHPPKGDLLPFLTPTGTSASTSCCSTSSAWRGCDAASWRRPGRGAIVNVSTFAAFEPDPDFPVSASLRTALAAFTKLYADRYAKAGIRMNNVLPGFIDSLCPRRKIARARIPMGRYGSVADSPKPWRFSFRTMRDT